MYLKKSIRTSFDLFDSQSVGPLPHIMEGVSFVRNSFNKQKKKTHSPSSMHAYNE